MTLPEIQDWIGQFFGQEPDDFINDVTTDDVWIAMSNDEKLVALLAILGRRGFW